MDVGGAEKPEPNLDQFGTCLSFNSLSPLGFRKGNRDYLEIQVWVWGR